MGATALDRVSVSGCTAKSFRCGDARNYNRELRDCCRSHLIAMASDVAATLNAAGVTWWADYGTLLGAVRNPMTEWADYPWLPQDRDTAGPHPGIVPHDKDADWGFLLRNWVVVHRALYVLGKRKGYDIVARKYFGKIKIRLSRLNHTNLDLFGWDEVPAGRTVSHARFDETVTLSAGMMYRPRYVGVDKCKGKEFHHKSLFPLGTVTWEGLKLPAPRDPESFLAHRYGQNWRTPINANHDGVQR